MYVVLHWVLALTSALGSALFPKSLLHSFSVKESPEYLEGDACTCVEMFAVGELESVAARPVFWRVCGKSALNLSSFN